MADTKRWPNDPDELRMSFGDHLEELRACMIRAALGVMVAAVVCFYFGNHIISVLAAPYYAAMQEHGFEPRMVQLNPAEPFREYFKITLEVALVAAAPWVLYQFWTFVAAGLYPHERRIVRLFAPASIVLFVTGAAFMIAIVLFVLLRFLIGISGPNWFPTPDPDANALLRWLMTEQPAVTTQSVEPPLRLPVLDGSPEAIADGDAWIRRHDHTLNVVIDGQRHSIRLEPDGQRQLVQPMFSISQYLGFVTGMTLAFGLGFQIPIVVIFLVWSGIVRAVQLARARPYIYLAIAGAAAMVTPPDIVSMLLLLGPMILLFESGVLIGRLLERRRTVDTTV
jgi:Tat protein translocase TatC